MKTGYKIRQGDVLLTRVKALPAKVKKIKDKTLAYGEVTGHSHRFVDDSKINRYEANSRIYLEVLQPVQLTHEEHNKWLQYQDGQYIPHDGIILPGIYEQTQERTYDYIDEEMKKVVD